jgi:hypothetical protein
MSIETYKILFQRPAFGPGEIEATLKKIQRFNETDGYNPDKSAPIYDFAVDPLLKVINDVKARLETDYHVGLNRHSSTSFGDPDPKLGLGWRDDVPCLDLIVVNKSLTCSVWLCFRCSPNPEPVDWDHDVPGRPAPIFMTGCWVGFFDSFGVGGLALGFDPDDVTIVDQIVDRVYHCFKVAEDEGYIHRVEKIREIDTDMERIEDCLPKDVPSTYLRI